MWILGLSSEIAASDEAVTRSADYAMTTQVAGFAWQTPLGFTIVHPALSLLVPLLQSPRYGDYRHALPLKA